MKQAIYILLFITILISHISGRNLQQTQENNNQNENNQNNQNQNQNNQGQNQNQNNQNQNQNNQNQNQESSVNCNENKNHPSCLKEDSNQIFEEMKSSVPDFINNMRNQSDSFSQLNNEEQMDKLNKEKSSLETMKSTFKSDQSPEKRKDMMEKATEIAEYLTKKDCSNSVNSSSSDILADSTFQECRNQKKEIMTDIISLVKDYVQCENIDDLISTGVSEDKQENFKYILFLIYEVSSNPDSLKKGESEILYNVTLCLQENFDTYWTSVESDITEEDIVKADVKQDVSLILIKTLSNLVNVHHYDEIDGYLDEGIKMSDNGLMKNEQAKKIHKGMLEFAQKFHDFGNATYNISSSMNISILKFDDLNDANLLNEEQVYNLSDKGIFMKFKPRKMLQDNDGNIVQFIAYDSPLVSINSSNEDNNIVRDFVSLAIFNEKGEEINITDLPEEARPEIFYAQNQNKSMKMCFFYNESKDDLDTNGMAGENVTVEGEKYLKCSSWHLTSFTASYSTASSTSTSDSTASTTSTSTTSTTSTTSATSATDNGGISSETQAKSSAKSISLMKWICMVFILWI